MTLSLSRLKLPAISGRELRYAKVILNDYRRRVLPAPAKPEPATWSDDGVTAAWLGHSTVLINFFGVNILTDPVLGARAGLGFGPLVLGPKRYVRSALAFRELPPIDLILLTHAHMDHFDLSTLRRFDRRPLVVTARHTSDLLQRTRLRGHLNELAWGESTRLKFSRSEFAPTVERGELEIEAFEVRHWGARMRTTTTAATTATSCGAAAGRSSARATRRLPRASAGCAGAAARRKAAPSTSRSCPSALTTPG